MSKFGTTIREARKNKGMTLREVAEKAKVSHQTVLRAERGHFISLEIIVKLFDVLRIRGPGSSDLLQQYVREHLKAAKQKAVEA